MIMYWMLVVGLASWRLTSMLHSEQMFGWLRHRLGILHGEDRLPCGYPSTWLGEMWECFWCLCLVVSLPISLGVGLLFPLFWWEIALLWLSSSTVAILAEKWMFRSRSRLE